MEKYHRKPKTSDFLSAAAHTQQTIWEKVGKAESFQTLDVASLGSMLLSCRDEWRWQMSWEGVGDWEEVVRQQ